MSSEIVEQVQKTNEETVQRARVKGVIEMEEHEILEARIIDGCLTVVSSSIEIVCKQP